MAIKRGRESIPMVEPINLYLDTMIGEVRERIMKMPEGTYHSWEELDRFFLSQLQCGI